LKAKALKANIDPNQIIWAYTL